MNASDIQRVAVIGTGLIGFSWAHIFCRHGLETRLYDVDPKSLLRGQRRLAEALDQFERLGLIDAESRRAAADRVRECRRLEEAVEGAQWVQENVAEDLDTKRRLFASLDEMAAADTVLASSLSTLRMSDVAALTTHPERCVGVHPTNPPHIVPLVEIIKTDQTSRDVVQMAMDFMIRVGQTPVLVQQQVQGYVLNRLQYALMREAFALLRDGVASANDIDRCVSEGLGLRWALIGPFAVTELNAAGIEDYFRKYGLAYSTVWRSLSNATELLDSDVELAAKGLGGPADAQSRDKTLTWRDEMVLAIRRLKDERPVVGLAEPARCDQSASECD